MYIPCRFHSSDATVPHAPPDSDPSFVAKRASSSFPTTNLLCCSVPPWRSSLSSLFSYFYELLSPQALCFENNPHCPGVCPPASLFQSFHLWVSVFLWQIDSFHTIADSLVSRKKSSALESRTSGLFCKNTRGGGGSIHDKTGFPIMFSMEFPSQETSACGAFRRVTSSRDVPVPEPLPTRGSLMLVFGLQDAARAAQVLALLTSSRCRLRFECFPCGRPMSRRAFARRGRSMPGLPHKKGTTNP